MSIFRSLKEFQRPLADGYKALALSLHGIEGQRLRRHQSGGQIGCSRKGELERFARHQLEPTSDLYGLLKSKHFLQDANSDVAIDLLALKVRTKLQRLSDFTSLHIFVVSLRCEHACPYCQVSRQSDDKQAFDMSWETAQRSLDLVFRSPAPNIKIEFQGGESLLNFPIIQKIVIEAERRNQRERRNLAFVIATNLAVVTDEMLAFCRDHNILISTSLDGPADLHNENRPRPGNNSHELTIAGIERSRTALGHDRVGALMTTSPRSLGRVREIIDEYVRLGFEGIFLRPLSPYGFAVKTKWYRSYGTEEWLSFYREGLDYILDLNRKGTRFVESYARTILTKMLTPFEVGYVDMMSPSGIGIAAVVYNYDGDVYASDEGRMLAEMGDRTFRLGNVHSDKYEDIFLSDALLDPLEASFAASAPMCSDCAFEPFCGSDPVFHHATQGDFVGLKPTSAFCHRQMAVMRDLISRMRADREVRQILKSWARP